MVKDRLVLGMNQEDCLELAKTQGVRVVNNVPLVRTGIPARDGVREMYIDPRDGSAFDLSPDKVEEQGSRGVVFQEDGGAVVLTFENKNKRRMPQGQVTETIRVNWNR